MSRYQYAGPSDVLVIGDKRFVKGGEPHELTEDEIRRFQSLPPGHRMIFIPEEHVPAQEDEQSASEKRTRRKKEGTSNGG